MLWRKGELILMCKKSEKQHIIFLKKIVFFLLFSLVYFVRLLFIDADICAPWGVLNYQPIDEGCYAELALNMENFGTINPNTYYNGVYDYYIGPQAINNLIGNAFSFVTMRFFGDTYLGLRLGPIIAGYMICILYLLILSELMKNTKNESSKIIFFFFSFYILFDFVFFNACRIVEPTLYRLLFLQFIIYIFIKSNMNDRIRFTAIGALTVLSIFLVYMTNVFICIALFILFVFLLFQKDKKKAGLFFLYNCLGGIVGYGISFLYYRLVWNTTPVRNVLSAVTAFRDVAGYADGHMTNITAFISSNVFLYNPMLLCLFIIAIPYCIKKIYKDKDINILFLLVLIISLFLQTLFSEDYIVRKALVIYPVVIYLVFVFLSDFKVYDKLFKNNLWILVITILSGLIMYNAFYRTRFIKNGTNLDFTKKDKILVFIMAVCAIITMLSMRIIKSSKKKRKCIFAGLFAVTLLNVLFIVKYNFLHITYSEKEIMQTLGEVADGKIVCFSFEYCITLYNDVKPLVCGESKMTEYMRENPDMYYYGFSDFPTFNNNPESINQHVQYVYLFEDRLFKTFGVQRDFALYEYKE